MTEQIQVQFSGDDAVRIIGLSREQRDGLYAHLNRVESWIEIVPGRESITVQFDPLNIRPNDAMQMLRAASDEISVIDTAPEALIEIPIAYGGEYGPDLVRISRELGISEEELITRHCGHVHRVDFLGFTPGFAYLYTEEELDIDVPRLARPRQRVEPGSIGVVGGTTGLYALSGPGGWPIIGRTPLKLFDPSSEHPSKLRSGLSVRFCPISDAEFDNPAE